MHNVGEYKYILLCSFAQECPGLDSDSISVYDCLCGLAHLTHLTASTRVLDVALNTMAAALAKKERKPEKGKRGGGRRDTIEGVSETSSGTKTALESSQRIVAAMARAGVLGSWQDAQGNTSLHLCCARRLPLAEASTIHKQ